ncbi:hypothetical protein L873DRAFT_1821880, partial [Choiromyces venosus 120613-1]
MSRPGISNCGSGPLAPGQLKGVFRSYHVASMLELLQESNLFIILYNFRREYL